MSLSSLIINCLSSSLAQQTAKKATEEILVLRKREGYLRTLLRLLVDNPPSELILSILTQLKVFSNQIKVSENDISFVKKIFLNILKMHSNSRTHKILRAIVKNLTQNYDDKWLAIQQYQQELNSDNDNLEWFVSALIGICEANRYARMFNKKSNLPSFQSFFSILIKKTQNCYSFLLHYITKFIERYIFTCQPKEAHEKVEQMLKFMIIGNNIWKTNSGQNQNSVSDRQQKNQMSKCKKWLLKLIHTWICKENQYRKTCQVSYNFEVWRHSEVRKFIKRILQKFNENNPYSNQHCFAPIMIWSIKASIEYIRLGQYSVIVPMVQKLLYINIPKLLYKLKEIISSNGQVLNMLDDTNKDEINLKSLLLILWRQLSMIDISELHCNEVQSLNNMLRKLNVSSNEQIPNKMVQQILPSFHLHWKFLFQKLSQTQTFFSSFSYRKELNDQSIWDFKDQGWAIVLFDLLKATYADLEKDQNLHLKKNIPVILLSYILPKLSRPHPLLQAQTLATVCTFWRQFQCLHIPTNIIESFANLFNEDTDDDVKNVLFRILPSIAGSAQINLLIRQYVDKIINLYTNILCQQTGDTRLSQSFKKILQFFGPNLQDPTKYFNKLTEDFFNQQLNRINYQGYVDCMQMSLELCTKQQHYQKIRQNFFKIVDYTLNFRAFDASKNQRDQFVQSDLIKIIGKYIQRVQQLNKQLIQIFGAYCFSVSGFNKDLLNMMNQESRRVALRYAVKNFPCEEETLLQMLHILQMFSIHIHFDIMDQYLGVDSVNLYIKTLNACYQSFQSKKQDFDQIYLNLQISILESCISLIEDFHDDVSIAETVLTEENVVEIWQLAIGLIQSQNRDQLFQMCKNSKNQNKESVQDDQEEWLIFSRKAQLNTLKIKIIQFLSDMIWLSSTMSSICFQQTPNLMENYLYYIQHTEPSHTLGKNHILRVIYGLSSTVHFDYLSIQVFTRIISCLQKYFLYEIGKQIKNFRSYDLQNKKWGEFDSQSQWEDDYDQMEGDLAQYKRQVVFDTANYIENVEDFIDVLRQSYPSVAKINKQTLKKMKASIKQMDQVCEF